MSLLNASTAAMKRGLVSSATKAPRMLNGRSLAPTVNRVDSAGMKASCLEFPFKSYTNVSYMV